MSFAVALPWILTGSAVVGLGAALLLQASADRTAREIAAGDLATLDAGDDVLWRLEPIVTEGETLLRTAAIRPISPELIESLGAFRQRAEAALQHAEAQPRPHEALRQLELEPDELLRTARFVVGAAIRLHDGAARYEPRELMHGEARHASARLSELAAKMADTRALIEAHRNRLLPRSARRPPGIIPIFGWRPQASK